MSTSIGSVPGAMHYQPLSAEEITAWQARMPRRAPHKPGLLKPGEIFAPAHLQIISPIAFGPMSNVYLAFDLANRYAVILKTICWDLDAHIYAAYAKEVAVLEMGSPLFPTLHAHGTVANTGYIAMENIEGIELRALLKLASPDFSGNEFSGADQLEALCQAINNGQYGYTINYDLPKRAQSDLKALLRSPAFCRAWREKHDETQLSQKTRALLHQAKKLENRDYETLTAAEQYLVRCIIRRLLQETFAVCPQKPLERMPLHQAIDIVMSVLSGLAVLHTEKLVHRDLKPENILGAGRVIDFGTVIGAEQKYDGIAGTPLYMAPEQARGEPVDPTADIFALGIIFFEMLAGYNPILKVVSAPKNNTTPLIEDRSPDAVPPLPLSAIVDRFNDKRFPPRETLGEVLTQLTSILNDMTADNPENRPSEAAGLLPRLEALRPLAQAIDDFIASPPAQT